MHITTVRTPSLGNRAAGNIVSLDLSMAQVPDRRYAADAVRVDVGEDMVRLFFAQHRPLGEGLQSLLLVRVPFLGARQFLRAMAGIATQLKAYLEKFNIRPPTPLDIKEVPNQTVTLDANIVAAGFSAREACLDFYHVSPYVILSLSKGGDVFAEPVVRVILTTTVLASIYEVLAAKKDALPADEMEAEL